MISPRHVALQGLTAPTLALVVALQGLWPLPQTSGGSMFAPEERARRERVYEDEVLSVIAALVTSGILET